MNWGRFNTGICTARIVCADASLAITQFHSAGIVLQDLKLVDDFTITFCIFLRHEKPLRQQCEKRGYELEIVQARGFYPFMRTIMKRPVLAFMVLILLFATWYLPSRILLIRVEGTQQVDVRSILAQAEQGGLYFGCNRSEIRSEKIKNHLLQTIPDLAWAGVNTSGCVATISVRERTMKEPEQESKAVGSIIAIRDGSVTEVICRKGKLLCAPGQAVKTGQVLISAYTDCGLTIQAVRAEGEIYATTLRDLSVKTLKEPNVRYTHEKTVTRYALIFQKNRINLYKGSGIYDSSCVRMYTQSYVTLPGGFILPFSVVKETVSYYSVEPAEDTDREIVLQQFAQSYLTQEMIAGRILQAVYTQASAEDTITLSGKFICVEMIGQIHSEEIIKSHE